MGAKARRIVATALGVLTACGYTSEYVPPADWRVRPVYRGNEIVVVGPAGPPVCADEIPTKLQPSAVVPQVMLIDGQGYWAPSTAVHVGAVPYPNFVYPVAHLPHPSGPHGTVVTGYSGPASSGGSDEALAILLALALLASSGVAIGLAADPAEKSRSAVASLDLVNQRNDQVRRKMTECARRLAPAAEGGSTP